MPKPFKLRTIGEVFVAESSDGDSTSIYLKVSSRHGIEIQTELWEFDDDEKTDDTPDPRVEALNALANIQPGS